MSTTDEKYLDEVADLQHATGLAMVECIELFDRTYDFTGAVFGADFIEIKKGFHSQLDDLCATVNALYNHPILSRTGVSPS